MIASRGLIVYKSLVDKVSGINCTKLFCIYHIKVHLQELNLPTLPDQEQSCIRYICVADAFMYFDMVPQARLELATVSGTASKTAV